MEEIKTIRNLKDEQSYRDRYDHFVVDECRGMERRFLEGEKKTDSEEEKRARRVSLYLSLYFLKGEMFSGRSEKIREWMNSDSEKDNRLDRANPRHDIFCLNCQSPMACTMKFMSGPDDDRVLFLFRCPECGKGRGFYDNGEEYRPTPHKCAKCGEVVLSVDTREGDKVTSIYDCTRCGFKETSVLELGGNTEDRDKQFIADRERFCLSEAAGMEFISFKAKFEHLKNVIAEHEEKKKQKDLYDEVAKIEKLNVADLEKHLGPALEKEGFIKLDLGKPELMKGVVINFTVQDSRSGVHEHDRKSALRKTIGEALSNTNWRMAEDTLTYSLGILSGRLRGLESEEDIVELVKSRLRKMEKKLADKDSQKANLDQSV